MAAHPLIAVVTGAYRGIGLELTRDLVGRNYKVFAAFRGTTDAARTEELRKLANVELVELNLEKEESINEAAAYITKQTSYVNLLYNNAGVYVNDGSLQNITLESLSKSFLVNTIAPTLFFKALSPLLVEAGKTSSAVHVFISTLMASIEDNTSGGSYAYRSSKVAVNMINKSAAIELAEKNVISLAIHPGYVKTEMTRSLWSTVPEGEDDGTISPVYSAQNIVKTTLAKANKEGTGKFYNYDGEILPY